MTRAYFRMDLPIPLIAEMTIIRIKDNKIESGKSKILVDNIGPGGLRYFSDLQLPVNPHIVLEFRLDLLDQPIRLIGYNVRREQLDSQLFQYGVSFTIDEEERLTLIKLLNDLQIRLRRGISLADRPGFFSGAPPEFFTKEAM